MGVSSRRLSVCFVGEVYSKSHMSGDEKIYSFTFKCLYLKVGGNRFKLIVISSVTVSSSVGLKTSSYPSAKWLYENLNSK